MYSFLVYDSSEPKKAKYANKNAAAKTSHNEYKDVFLNKKWLRHSINKIQSKIIKVSVPNSLKAQKMCENAVIEEPFTTESLPDCYKTQYMCKKMVDEFHVMFQFLLDC